MKAGNMLGEYSVEKTILNFEKVALLPECLLCLLQTRVPASAIF